LLLIRESTVARRDIFRMGFLAAAGSIPCDVANRVDVTDPAHPQYLAHIPGTPGNYEAGGAQMTRVCDGSALPKGDPNKTYLLRVFGGKAIKSMTSPIPRSLC
jgi:hypothetical protein